MLCGGGKGGSDEFLADQGADAIVYRYEPVARDFFKTSFYRLEAGHTSGLQRDVRPKAMLLTQAFPCGHFVFRENEDDMKGIGIVEEGVDGVHDDREAVYLHDLFGHLAIDPGALATRHDNGVFAIQFLWNLQPYRMSIASP